MEYCPPRPQREECDTEYLTLKEVARRFKRSEECTPEEWVNFCKWAWDEAVED